MSGKIRIYFLFGFIGFLVTYAVSAGNNLFTTSLFRGLIGFAAWFALSYAAGWVINFLKEQETPPDVKELAAKLDEEEIGSSLDITTPDQNDELIDLLKQTPDNGQQGEEFTPLQPPKLVKTQGDGDKDPEELAKAVRHLTEN
ncbi:hypothetical protein V3851_05025 [Paenibacillus sp. M1]|uniref:Uncharacterized protein n=1 Tax=Paenibacillus haidiansis TaxID=1574488 RepID=A0ABU7VP62_9BACL